jgi:hypothetical protein
MTIPTFRIGDRVRAIDDWGGYNSIGDTGVIAEYYRDPNFVRVQWDNYPPRHGNGLWYIMKNKLESIENEPSMEQMAALENVIRELEAV